MVEDWLRTEGKRKKESKVYWWKIGLGEGEEKWPVEENAEAYLNQGGGWSLRNPLEDFFLFVSP